jgi:hypothetical protein
MSVRLIQTNIPSGLYGVAALRMIIALIEKLQANGTLSAADKQAIVDTTIREFPQGDPHFESLRQLLVALTGAPSSAANRPPH